MKLEFEWAHNHQLKSFMQCIQCLYKIGKEISLECTIEQDLIFRCFNDTYSMCIWFRFPKSFFDRVVIPSKILMMSSDSICIQCKLFIKTLHMVVRNLHHVHGIRLVLELNEEDVDKMEGNDEKYIELQELEMQFACEYDIKKTFRIYNQEMNTSNGPVLRTAIDPDALPNSLCIRVYHFSKLLGHIHHTNEIRLVLTNTAFFMQSYLPTYTKQTQDDHSKHLETETKVDIGELMEYEIPTLANEECIELVFSIREIKAWLTYCEASHISEVTMRFDQGGSPIVLTSAEGKNDAAVSSLTLSTLAPPDGDTETTQSQNDENTAPSQTSSEAKKKICVRESAD